ncbi:uncharacterized protein A4U43_C07F10190 [Asparagus officinalis]|uniref:Uncharacterized protein n=1 Tax=Asparagus officinalis TaxID=4686 RepID=A0A5P1EAY7_ASPOF|nr:uncharacterized protein A4U43_C07F10190 [Asparagus officinalis]
MQDRHDAAKESRGGLSGAAPGVPRHGRDGGGAGGEDGRHRAARDERGALRGRGGEGAGDGEGVSEEQPEVDVHRDCCADDSRVARFGSDPGEFAQILKCVCWRARVGLWELRRSLKLLLRLL